MIARAQERCLGPMSKVVLLGSLALAFVAAWVLCSRERPGLMRRGQPPRQSLTVAGSSKSLFDALIEEESLHAPYCVWERVNGGANQACRGATVSDNEDRYFVVHEATSSIDDCLALCEKDKRCKGTEYQQHMGRCEVWLEEVGTSNPVFGFACYRCKRVAKSMTAEGFGIEWEPVDGGRNQACRTSQRPRDPSHVEFALVSTTSLYRCQEQCIMARSCTGIEYSSSNGRCEVWNTEITEGSKVSNYVCLRHTSQFEKMDGAVDRACRGSSPSDDSDSYYEKESFVVSVQDCKALCLNAPICKGIEFHAWNGRCEVWTHTIEATTPYQGANCFRNIASW
jgi:hypothetical protein